MIFFMKIIIRKIFIVLDILLFPLVFVSALLLGFVRRFGVAAFPACRAALLKAGVMPVINHYYEPLFDERNLRKPLSEERGLPGIDWNIKEQLALLSSFNYEKELEGVPFERRGDLDFYFSNPSFKAGDAEYWYAIIRHFKPANIIEIGSGNSTKMAVMAINKNREEDPAYECSHICVEPYEMPWLEKTGVKVIREKAETVNINIFRRLKENDILFIDSSHMIRPQGDVLFEYLELLPVLNKGAIVHIHDIFSPRDYPKSWLIKSALFWNEQYLLEAFLTMNKDYSIIGALNYLHHRHYEMLKEKCPKLTRDCEPGSFYIKKIN